MQIAMLLFDDVTALDVIGPYEVLKFHRGAEVRLVAAEPGPKTTENGPMQLVADTAFGDLPAPDVIVVPGGLGGRAVMSHEPTLAWLRQAHRSARWTTSVCFGSLILGAAGLLRGRRATTHWLWHDHLAQTGATPVNERVVRDDPIMTAAGVSAGIDMALTLLAELTARSVAEAVQLVIEYDPEPPFSAGSPATAPASVVDAVRSAAAAYAPRALS